MSETTQAALSGIEAGIEAVRTSERFRAYLGFCGRFHKYSFNNQLLIWSQRPDATLVAGFQAWRRLKRHVRKGEKGILILAPITGKRRGQHEANEVGVPSTFLSQGLDRSRSADAGQRSGSIVKVGPLGIAAPATILANASSPTCAGQIDSSRSVPLIARRRYRIPTETGHPWFG